MDSAHLPSLCQPTHPAPTNQGQKQGRASRFKGKLGRPSRRSIVGLKSYFNRCIRAGKLREASAFHAAHDLARYGIPSPPLPSSLAPSCPASGYATHGGEGVDQPHGRDNWDKTTPAVQILQCSPVATAGVVPLAVEADLTRLAAKAVYTPTVTPPAGESEGDRGFGQAESRSGADLGENVVSVWPKLAEGVVGKVCRNKQYNELRVVGEDGRELWTKVGNWLFAGGLVRGERVLVRKVWGSGDDTDAEYEVVRRMDVNEEVPQVPTVVEQPLVEPSAVSELETPVAILPQFQREEPDYPRKQESADDYIARIRAEAAKWANGQGR